MLKCKDSETHFTQTREGKIYHLLARIGGFDMCMPVKLKPDSRGRPMPVRDSFGYVYALPANGSISLSGERSWPR